MATAHDAKLILQLYDLRREPVLREARDFVTAIFKPVTFADLQAVQRPGSQENKFYKQVLTYWEMAASFVVHGALDVDLFLDNGGEAIFIYSKFTPFFSEYAKAAGQPFMPQMTKLIETYPAAQERYAMTLARVEAGRKEAEAAKNP